MSKHPRRKTKLWGQRLEHKMKARVHVFRKYRWWGFWILALSLIINSIWDQVVWNTILNIWTFLQSVFVWVFALLIKNLAVTAFVLLCLWVGGLFGHAYFSILPPRGVFVHPLDSLHAGEGAWSGFSIENRSGEDLVRVWLTDKKSKLKLQWGRIDPSQKQSQSPRQRKTSAWK